MVYWNRDTVGVKVKATDGDGAEGWTQRFYFGRKFPTIAVNILLAAKLCKHLAEHDAEYALSDAAYDFFTRLCITAAAAQDRYHA